MFNAVTKLSTLATALLILTITACSGKKETNNEARELITQAREALDNGNPARALALIDSCKKQFPDSIDLLKQGLTIRYEATLQQTLNDIASVNDSIDIYIAQVEQLKPLLRQVAHPIEPYYVAKDGYNPDFLSSTGLQACVDEPGQFYIKSSVQSALKHTGITLSAADGTSASAGPVPYDGEMNYRINGSEVITFSPDQCVAIGQFASAHRDSGATLTFTGGKKHTIKLTPKQVNAIATCYEYANAMTNGRRLNFTREKLKRKIDATEQQMNQQR